MDNTNFFRTVTTDDIDRELSLYDWFELYNSSKKYSTETYVENYGYGSIKYVNVAIVFFRNSRTSCQHYIVAERYVPEEDLIQYQKYCQCKHCNYFFLNPMRLFITYKGSGCMWDVFPSQEVIRKTTTYLMNHGLYREPIE